MKGNDIDNWDSQVRAGQQYKEKWGDSKNWGVYRNYYRGAFPNYRKTNSRVLPLNLVYAMARTLVPNVYFRNPYVNVTPRYMPGFEVNAKIVEAVDNWLIQELAIKDVMKKMVFDSFFTNRSFIKLGYDSQFGFSPSQTLQNLGLTDTTLSSLGKDTKRWVEYNENIKPGMPWALHIPADYIIVPYGTRDLADLPWIDHVVLRRLDDVKNDAKYKNTEELEGTHMEILKKDRNMSRFYTDMDKDENWVEIHEIRDLARREIKAMVLGYDKWLREPEEDVLQIEGVPFVDICYNQDTNFFWGPSDVKIMEPQQLELNEARTQAMLHRRVSLVKFLIEREGMKKDEVEKMLSESVAPVAFTEGKPNDVVNMLQPHIPPDLVQWSEIIRSDVRELLGMGRQQLGEESKSSRKTATESKIIQQAHELRLSERRDLTADCLSKLVRKLNQIIFKMWDSSRVVQVVGYDGARYWVEYTNKAIIGEYNLKVDVESMSPVTKALKKKDIVELIGALGNYPRANIDYLLRQLLREYEWLDAMKILPPAQETEGQPMTARQFGNQQQKLLKKDEYRKGRVKENKNMVKGML